MVLTDIPQITEFLGENRMLHWDVLQPKLSDRFLVMAKNGPVAKFFRTRFFRELRFVGLVLTQLKIEIRASKNPIHNQQLAHTAFSRSSHTGQEKFATGPTTVPFLAVALDLLRLRGFRYVSTYTWGKDKAGTGYWSRNRNEFLLIGTRGNIPAPAPGTQWDSVVKAPGFTHEVALVAKPVPQ